MNDNKEKFNLYEDNDRKDPNLSEQPLGTGVSDPIIVYVNFNDELPNLIKPIREILEDKPEGFRLGIYIVTGFQVNSDIVLFLDYLLQL